MTITSNIHVGLLGWSNATYTVGQRRSNAGNAYQVITAGTSTAPPTGTGSNIAPGGTAHWKFLSAIDFTTLQAWADSIPSTLTQPYVGNPWFDGVVTATAGVTLLTLAGHTTSSTNTITLVPAAGEGILAFYGTTPTAPWRYDNTHGFAIECPATGFGGINYIQVDDSNVIFRGIQVKDLNASSGATIIGGLGMIWLDKCLIEGQSQSSGARMIQMGAASVKITNSLIIDHSIGNPSATVEAAGTGCVIAYSTFVKTSPASGAAALDANTNVTVASNSVTGCIFVGYDIPFAAATAQPWITNHNAFTNASFTSTSAATDTGGSVFGATSSTLFVNPTTDYHQNPSSPCLNAGVTDTTDIATADDFFGVSRPQGANWDIGPHELLAGSVISRDFVNPVTFNKSSARDAPVAIAQNVGISGVTSAGSPEWRQSRLYDFYFYSENKASSPVVSPYNPFSSDFSADFGSGGVSAAIVDITTPIEFQGSIAQPQRDISVPLEWRMAAQADTVGQSDWRSSTGQSAVVFGDWINQLRWDVKIPGENKYSFPSLPAPFSGDFSPDFGLGPYTINPSFSMEFGSTAQVDGLLPLASVRSFVRDALNVVEWRGVSVTSGDASVPIEWRSSIAQSAVLPSASSASTQLAMGATVEWLIARFGIDLTSQIESKSGIGATSTGWMDWPSLLSVTAPTSIEFGQSVARSVSPATEFVTAVSLSITLSSDPHLLLQADTAGQIESSAGKSRNFVAPLEVGGGSGAGVPVDFAVPVEWRGGISVDTQIGIAVTANVRADILVSLGPSSGLAVDYTLGSAWGAIPLTLMIAATEWGHLLLSRSRDDAMALEILATVKADINVPSNRRVGQKSIGSQLVPDNWEEENEPC